MFITCWNDDILIRWLKLNIWPKLHSSISSSKHVSSGFFFFIYFIFVWAQVRQGHSMDVEARGVCSLLMLCGIQELSSSAPAVGICVHRHLAGPLLDILNCMCGLHYISLNSIFLDCSCLYLGDINMAKYVLWVSFLSNWVISFYFPWIIHRFEHGFPVLGEFQEWVIIFPLWFWEKVSWLV